MHHAHRTVLLDTAGLWSLESLISPRKHRDPRWREYLANLSDYVTDPNRQVQCIMPSRKRRKGPLPSFYKALKAAGLLNEVKILSPTEFYTPLPVLASQFREFARHVRANRPLVTSWFNLHNHHDIRRGWLIGLPQQSKWRGVQAWLQPHLTTTLGADLNRLSDRAGWSRWRTAVTFSFIQRGYSYAQAALSLGAEYFTHPARWQVLPNETTRGRDSAFGLALGGLVINAVDTHCLRRDAAEIANALAGFKQRLRYVAPQRRDVQNLPDAIEFVNELAVGLVGARPKPAFERIVKNLAAGLFTLGISALVPASVPATIALWVGANLVIQPFPLTLAPREAALFRRWVDYPRLLQLSIQTCYRDGAALVGGRCPVCALRHKEAGAAGSSVA